MKPEDIKKILLPIPKPRNPNLPKGSQRHEDKRKKEKYKGDYLNNLRIIYREFENNF